MSKQMEGVHYRRKPIINSYQTQKQIEDDYHNPPLLDYSVPQKAIVIEKGSKISKKLAGISTSEGDGAELVMRIKAVFKQPVDGVLNPHKFPVTDRETGEQIDPQIIIDSLPHYYAISDQISNDGIPDIDDEVFISIQNGQRYYHGFVNRGAVNSGARKIKQIIAENFPGLQDTTNMPANGSPVPQVNNNASMPTLQNNSGPPQPGLYPVHKMSEQPYDYLEMVIIGDGVSLLYPKKYHKVVQAMREQYKNDTGQTLGITSAYRDVNKQKKLYDDYISGRSTTVAAKPGFSKHNDGLALDFDTVKEFNNKFKQYGSNNKNEAISDSRNADFGAVAQWLSNNSEKFGFVWTGYAFDELWHYELVPDKIPPNLRV